VLLGLYAGCIYLLQDEETRLTVRHYNNVKDSPEVIELCVNCPKQSRHCLRQARPARANPSDSSAALPALPHSGVAPVRKKRRCYGICEEYREKIREARAMRRAKRAGDGGIARGDREAVKV